MTQTTEYSLYTDQGLRKYINEEEVQRFLGIIVNLPEEKKLFFLMLYYTGARISEALNVKPLHVDFAQKSIAMLCLKRRKKGMYRAIPLPEHFLEELRVFISCLKMERSFDRIWNWSRRTASRYVSQVMKEANVVGPQACARGLRHHFGVNCVVHGIGLPLIQKWMGHASILTTQIYTQVIGKEERRLAEKMWSKDMN